MRSLVLSLGIVVAGSVGLQAFAPAAHAVDFCSTQSGFAFCEDFDGYTSFPGSHPPGDPINFGEPLISEGADNDWYAGRFEVPDQVISNDPIEDIRLDVGVQSFGGGGNSTPVGRVGDDAGILFKVDLTNATSADLSFDWRMFSAISTDKLVVGYHVGDDLGFGPSTPVIDFVAQEGGQAGAIAWWQNEWTQLMRDNQGNSFSSESFSLDAAVGDVVWLAFWVDNGDADFAKIDNILVTASVPEPALIGLLAISAALATRVRRQS